MSISRRERLLTNAACALAPLAVTVLLTGCSGSNLQSAPAGSALPSVRAQGAAHGLAGPRLANVHNVTLIPGKLAQMLPPPLAGAQQPSSMTENLSPNACKVIYLSDNINANVRIIKNAGTFPTIATLRRRTYTVGASRPQLPSYMRVRPQIRSTFRKPCGTQIGFTYTGNNNGGSGGVAPLGIAVDTNAGPPKGCVYGDEWPVNLMNVFCPPALGAPATFTDPLMGLPYYIAVDKFHNVWLSGWDPSFTFQQIDECSPPPGLTCATKIAIPSPSFPGGITFDKTPQQFLIVNNQYGTLYSFKPPYSCGTCLKSTFAYSNGTNPLDYTAIALNPANGKLWAAHIFYCTTSSSGICGDAQSQIYKIVPAIAHGALGGLSLFTPSINNGEPLGIALWKPAPE